MKKDIFLKLSTVFKAGDIVIVETRQATALAESKPARFVAVFRKFVGLKVFLLKKSNIENSNLSDNGNPDLEISYNRLIDLVKYDPKDKRLAHYSES